MSFDPAHDAVVLYTTEQDPFDGTNPGIVESADGDTPAAFYVASPTVAGSILGYTDLPQSDRGLNNSKGFSLGAQAAVYNKRGMIQPTITVNIRPGNVAFLANLLPDANGKLPYLCIAVQVKGQYVDYYRYCKPDSVAFNFAEGQGQGGEITISVTFQALAYHRGTSISFPVLADIRALGIPLMWHDVREFTIAHPSISSGAAISFRTSLMSLSLNVKYNLERKSQRPNWNDQYPLSRTSVSLLEHHQEIEGQAVFHQRLPETYFSAAANAQDWGNIVLRCKTATGQANAKNFTITLGSVLPTTESRNGGESSSEIDHTIPFSASAFALVST